MQYAPSHESTTMWQAALRPLIDSASLEHRMTCSRFKCTPLQSTTNHADGS